MKAFILAGFLLISVAGFSQAKLGDVTYVNKDTQVWTEPQLQILYQLINISKLGFYDTDLTGRQIKEYSIFVDSLSLSWNHLYAKWHPAPAAVPKDTTAPIKTDSTAHTPPAVKP